MHFHSRDWRSYSSALLRMKNSIAILVLAAGHGRRFGSDKRMALVYERQTLLRETLSRCCDTGLDVHVSLSAREEDEPVAESIADLPLRIHRCERAEEGMGGTIADSIFLAEPYAAVFIFLGDMPFLDTETITKLRSFFRPGHIVVPRYRGRRGHPVLFSAAFFPELCELTGDRGGADILRRHRERCIEVDVDDPGILRDIDTPGDLASPSGAGGQSKRP